MVCGLHTFAYLSARTAESTACSMAPRECSQGLKGTRPLGNEESRLCLPAAHVLERQGGMVVKAACGIRAASFHLCEWARGFMSRTPGYSSPNKK